jgi:DNA-binding XRE family transcriptional regulator
MESPSTRKQKSKRGGSGSQRRSPTTVVNNAHPEEPMPLSRKDTANKTGKKNKQHSTSTSTFKNATERPLTSPNLFSNGEANCMASALPIWEASNILTRRNQLPWQLDDQGKLCYAKKLADGEGAIHFWVTENLDDEHPATLAGAAALAVVDAFDIRAACMHLIYAAHATQLERPWEEELVIDDRQIEAYLGLKKRTDKSRREKLAFIEEIAKQPCKITTYISWPTQGRVKGITLEEGRLWHMMATRYHYQQDLFGNKELAGITFIVRPGQWAKYFLNEEGRSSKVAYCQQGILSQKLLENVMGVWQHREGAARLMVWLLFKTQFDRNHPLRVQTLMEVAYGRERVHEAQCNSDFRKKFVSTWDDDLMSLHERGWTVEFDPNTYPQEIQPLEFGREKPQRPKGYFDQLLAAQLWITPQASLIPEAIAEPLPQTLEPPIVSEPAFQPLLDAESVRALRTAKGWTQRKLAALTGLSQSLISLIETGERVVNADSQKSLMQALDP